MARYIERNPLKSGLVQKVEDYRWSSAKAHIAGIGDDLLSPETWLAAQERHSYASFIYEDDVATNDSIRKATRTGHPFGSENFREMLEVRLNQSLKTGRPGRPRKETGDVPI